MEANDFFVKSFMRASLFGSFFFPSPASDFLIFSLSLSRSEVFTGVAFCRAVSLVSCLLSYIFFCVLLHFVKCAARVNI